MEKQVRRLCGQKNILLAGYVLVILLYILCIVMLLIDMRISVILVNVATVFYFLVMRTMDRRYNREFVMANLSEAGKSFLDEIHVFRRGTVTCQELAQSGLIPVRERGGAACGISAEGFAEGKKARFCELTLCYDRAKDDADADTRKKKHAVGILDGVWADCMLPCGTGHRMVLFSAGIFDQKVIQSFYESGGWKKQVIKKLPAAESFCMFTDADVPESCVEAFLKAGKKLIREAGGQKLFIGTDGTRICVLLPGKRLMFDTPIRGAITEDILAWNRMPELGGIFQFFHSIEVCRQ